MGFIFLCYFLNFLLVFKGKKKLACWCFILSTTLSLLKTAIL